MLGLGLAPQVEVLSSILLIDLVNLADESERQLTFSEPLRFFEYRLTHVQI